MRKLILLLAFFFVGLQVFAQNVVTGTVTSADDGSTLPGVSVMVKGTTVGTVTDVDGKYSLKVPEGGKILVFSFVGMKSQEQPISGSVVNAALGTEDVLAEEVVVTAFGIKRNPKELGVATTKVSDKEITEGGSANVVNGLTGKVSGLQINTVNNGVNPDSKITLRGNRHFLASNQALVVLDGVPISAQYLNSINPNDIESVNVLKGASAAALYGNDASNGVIVVTTKKGEKKKPIIRIGNITTFERISYLPNLQTRFGGGSGEDTVSFDPNYTFWIGRDRNTYPYTSYENQSYGPEFNGQEVILGGKLEDGSYQTVPYSAIEDQKMKFFDTGITMQNNISYSSGDDKSSYFLSLQDVKTTGTVPGDKNRRTSARFSSGRVYGIFNSDFTIGYTKTNTDVSGGDFNQGRGVYWNVLNTPAHVPITRFSNLSDKFSDLNGYFNAYYPNPYWQIEHSRQLTKTDDILGSMSFGLTPVKWLTLSNRTGFTYRNQAYNSYQDEAVYSDYAKGDPWGAQHNATQSPFAGKQDDWDYNSMVITNDFLATMDQEFGDFSAKLIVGGNIYSQKTRYIQAYTNTLVLPEFYNISNRTGEPVVTETKNERNQLGLFADATFGYKKFFFVHVSGRNDWDSRLVKENRSFFYPAVDMSSVLTDAVPSLKNNVLSFLKVRAGWSKTGQIALSNWYATLPSFVTGSGTAYGFPYGANPGFALSTRLSNRNLLPEMTTEMEGGIETSFLNDRIHLEINGYKAVTVDQTIPAAISPATGYNDAYINAGKLETRGLEVGFKMTPLLYFGDFKWNLTVNYTYNTSEVLEIMEGLDELFIYDGTAAGRLVSVSYATKGEQFPAIKVTDLYRDPQGRVVVDAVTGLPKKAQEVKQMGHGNPNHMLGIVNNLTWKGFSLSIVTDYRTGNVIANMVGNALDFTGVSEHSAQNGRQPFVFPNSVIETSPGVFVPNTDVIVKDVGTGRGLFASGAYHDVQSTYVTSAAFWKLREISLNYEVPTNIVKATKVLSAAQIGIVGRNLLMFRPKTNVWTDPEFNAQGGSNNNVGYTDENQTPPTRIYGFSINLTF